MLLGATLLPVAAVLSSEDIEMSASCPNESGTTDEGDLSVIPDQCIFTADGWGLLSSSWHVVIGLIGTGQKIENHVNIYIFKKYNDLRKTRQFTLWSNKLLKIAPCDASAVIPISTPTRL